MARDRRKAQTLYHDAFAEHLETQKLAPGSLCWMYNVLVGVPAIRDLVIEDLQAHGIEARPTFPLLSEMPYYVLTDDVHTPIAADIVDRGITLPTGRQVTQRVVDRIVERFTKLGVL